MRVTREGRAPEGRFVVVAFDIAADRRRRRLARALTGFGVRSQLSVFECLVRGPDEGAFRAAIEAELDVAIDRLAVYELCAACRGRAHYWGTPLALPPEGSWIL